MQSTLRSPAALAQNDLQQSPKIVPLDAQKLTSESSDSDD